MDRTACVDVPALPLQLLLRAHPSWRSFPVAVVRDDRPQGIILWANTQARCLRILPGMTYAAGQSLATELRAAVVPQEQLDETVAELHLRLTNFSPRVEPSKREPGVFWIDPSGLVPLYGSLEQWGQTIRNDLRHHGFESSLVVGFHRYRSYALARTHAAHRMWVVPSAHIEAAAANKVALDRLDISPSLRDHLRVLGIRTLGDYLRLPAAELQSRFGAQAAALHREASDKWVPLTPRKLVDPIRAELQLDPPDADHTRLLFGLKGLLHRLMEQLAARSQALRILHLKLQLDHAADHDEFVEPARACLDVMTLLDLVRLRLEALSLPAPIEGVIVELEGTQATKHQLDLFRTQKRRDLDTADRALAQLRASLGPEAVTRPTLRAAHLPEASYCWEPIKNVQFPNVDESADDEPLPLVRRVYRRPIPLPPRPRHEPEAWLGRYGAVSHMHGPYRISGGWWVRTVERDYYYAQTQNGAILWVYYDRPRRRWFLHGYVD